MVKPKPHLNILSSKTWEEVWTHWQDREAPTGRRSIWESVWTERGFNNWADWRIAHLKRYHLSEFGLENLIWNEVEVLDPADLVPEIHIPPYLGWSIYHPEKKRMGLSYQEILQSSELQKNIRIQDLKISIQTSSSPRHAIVLLDQKTGRYMVIEGLHTISAYALASQESSPLQAPLHFYLAEIPDSMSEHFQKLINGEIPLEP